MGGGPFCMFFPPRELPFGGSSDMSTLGESIWRDALAGSSNLILLVEVAVVHAVYEFSLLKCPCVWGGPPRILSLLPNLLAYWYF